MTQKELDNVLSEHRKWLDDKGGKRAYLFEANLTGAYLTRANLTGADLTGVNLARAYLTRANLTGANLTGADLTGADLTGANLTGADLTGADLTDTRGLVKIMGAEPGNHYWKRIDDGFANNGYQYRIGMNRLYEGEVFAADERVMCSHPGLHFSSRSWAKREFGCRPYEARIRIPEGAQINEPWATDGKASADMIKIVQVFRDGKDVTEEIRAKYGVGE